MSRDSGESLFGENAGPINYRSATPSTEWVVIASFPTAGQWHAANRILSQRGIIGQMRALDSPEPAFELLVGQTEAEWARDLLNAMADLPQRIKGFPVTGLTTAAGRPTGSTTSADAAAPSAGAAQGMRVLPIKQPALTPVQESRYTSILIICWVLLAVVILLVVGAIFALPND